MTQCLNDILSEALLDKLINSKKAVIGSQGNGITSLRVSPMTKMILATRDMITNERSKSSRNT